MGGWVGVFDTRQRELNSLSYGGTSFKNPIQQKSQYLASRCLHHTKEAQRIVIVVS